MPTVRTNQNEDVHLSDVSVCSTAYEAAHVLWTSVHYAAKIFGGKALIRTPTDGEESYRVLWEDGPHQWAHAYAVCEGGNGKGFTTDAVDALTVQFTDTN